jgi:hypothetical protein
MAQHAEIDFSRDDVRGSTILYPETEEAEDWIAENKIDELDHSGGIVADEELLDQITRAGLTVQDHNDGAQEN